MIELAGGLDAVAEIPWTQVPTYAIRGTAAPPEPPRALPEPLGTRRLVGEIVDPKCFLGVMKPGQGRAHAGCAGLCIIGRIPPMLVVTDDTGRFDALVMTGPEGEALEPDLVLPHVGHAVELEGTLVRAAGLISLRVDPGRIMPHRPAGAAPG